MSGDKGGKKQGMVWIWDGAGARNVIDHSRMSIYQDFTEGDGAAKFLFE